MKPQVHVRSISTILLLVWVLLLGAPAASASPAMVGVEQLLDAPAYEPTLGITPSGALFYPTGIPTSGPFGVPLGSPMILGQSEIAASYDGGASWTNVTPPFALGPDYQEAIDPYLTVDPITGRVFRAIYQIPSAGGGGCIDLIWSDDDGETWRHQPKACGFGGFAHDHESLATGVPRTPIPTIGYPNLVYLCVNRLEGSGCSVSRDGGLTFGPWVNVYPSLGADYGWCGGLHAPVVTDSEGRVFLPRTYCGIPSIAVSEDEGLTWTIHKIDTKHPPAPSELVDVGPTTVNYIDVQDVMVTVDSKNNLYAAWVAKDGFVYVSASRDHGRSWDRAWKLEVPGVTAVGPSFLSIEASAPGKLAFAFVGTDHPGGLKNDTAKDWKGARWDLYIAATENGLSDSPKVKAVMANSRNDPIGMNTCGLDRCQPCEWTCPGMYDYIDVDIDGVGRPWVAFVDVCQTKCRSTGKIDEAIAAVATLAEGPALTAKGGRLPGLTWAATTRKGCSRCS
jgi:hypothetical protein